MTTRYGGGHYYNDSTNTSGYYYNETATKLAEDSDDNESMPDAINTTYQTSTTMAWTYAVASEVRESWCCLVPA